MRLVFVHGWNVSDTKDYGALPDQLKNEGGETYQIDHLYLTKYISFDDELSLSDLALAFDGARRKLLGDQPFACVAHSTGSLLIRQWLHDFDQDHSISCPLSHLIMLAPANFGSALAQLGKSRVGRLLAWFDGKEPGQKILDSLELGSDTTWRLGLESHRQTLSSRPLRYYPFVIAGLKIDSKLYDCLNSYTGESSSDGVIRSSSANLNSRYFKIVEKEGQRLVIETSSKRDDCPFLALAQASHSGARYGIVTGSERSRSLRQSLLPAIKRCLDVDSMSEYSEVFHRFEATNRLQRSKSGAMLVVKVFNQQGKAIEDFDLVFTAGDKYSANELPRGFLLDRQKNSLLPNSMTFYFDHDRLKKIPNGHFGFSLVARPSEGFSAYAPLEFRGGLGFLSNLMAAHQCTLLEIVCKRSVDQQSLSFVSGRLERESFIDETPSGVSYP